MPVHNQKRKVEESLREDVREEVLRITSDVIWMLSEARLRVSVARMSVAWSETAVREVAHQILAAAQYVGFARREAASLDRLGPIELDWISERVWKAESEVIARLARWIVAELRGVKERLPLEEVGLLAIVEELEGQVLDLVDRWPV